MTLIVGIRCIDGIVVGADGAATLGVLGQTTARQVIKKLSILNGVIILGVSGPVGLAQRIQGETEALWADKAFSGKKPFEAMAIIRSALWKHLEPELKAAQVSMSVVGPQAAAQSAICSTVLALPVSKNACLFQFDHQGAPEEASDKLPFVSIGSGQPIADPFLAFLRRIFWPGRLPNLSEGVFTTLWVLNHAIATAPGGISEPVQIVVLERSGDGWRARELPEEEQQEHQEAITFAEQHLACYRESFSRTLEGRTPEPPKPA
jgi:hypothetical protein